MKRTKCCGVFIMSRYDFEIREKLRKPARQGAQFTDYECCSKCGKATTEDNVEEQECDDENEKYICEIRKEERPSD